METKAFMEKAIRNCSRVQKEASLMFFRGLLNFQLHRFYDSMIDFSAAIELEEDSNPVYYLARGRALACMGILTEAMKDISVAVNLDETIQ